MEYSYDRNDLSFSKYLAKCFLWMFVGLLITFGSALLFSISGLYLKLLASLGTFFILGISILEIVLVISVSRVIFKLDTKKAISLFIAYSIINGITFSSIFYLFELSSIVYVFLITSLVFGAMALIGYTTKVDLSKLGSFISISLILLLISGIILMFINNDTIYLMYMLIGVGLFMLITAYDIHIIKRMYNMTTSYEQQNALAIYGALQLYLDFINLFIRLLSLFARNRD